MMGPLSLFRETAANARAQLQDALRAAQQPSAFQQMQPPGDPSAMGGMPQGMPLQGMPPQQQQQEQGQGGDGLMQLLQMLQMQPQQEQMPPPQVPQFARGGAVWQRKEGKDPTGGLNAKGRASLRAKGHDIKPPVSAKQAKKSPKAAARRKSFCARTGSMPGPMKDDSGKPTRKALALRKWDC
jgi:hypothetical protein